MKKLIFTISVIFLGIISINTNANFIITKNKNVFADSTQKKAVDPVCEMKIKQSGSKTTIYNKVCYYFCSAHCRQKFIATLSEYLKK